MKLRVKFEIRVRSKHPKRVVARSVKCIPPGLAKKEGANVFPRRRRKNENFKENCKNLSGMKKTEVRVMILNLNLMRTITKK